MFQGNNVTLERNVGSKRDVATTILKKTMNFGRTIQDEETITRKDFRIKHLLLAIEEVLVGIETEEDLH